MSAVCTKLTLQNLKILLHSFCHQSSFTSSPPIWNKTREGCLGEKTQLYAAFSQFMALEDSIPETTSQGFHAFKILSFCRILSCSSILAPNICAVRILMAKHENDLRNLSIVVFESFLIHALYNCFIHAIQYIEKQCLVLNYAPLINSCLWGKYCKSMFIQEDILHISRDNLKFTFITSFYCICKLAAVKGLSY